MPGSNSDNQGPVRVKNSIDEYPAAEYGKHSNKNNSNTILPPDSWQHIQNDHQVTRNEIRDTIENPDELWVSQTPQGQDWYMWVKTINGKVVVVRGARVKPGEIQIGTSFKPTNGYRYVRNWANSNSANKIHP